MNTKTLFGILTITASFAMNGRSQVYQFTAPISGGMTLSVGASDVNFGSHYGAGGTGTNWMAFNTLSETVYLDTVSNTLRQVGTISYSLSGANIQFQITSESNVIGNATVYLAPSAGNLSFDTGPQSMYVLSAPDCDYHGSFYGSTFWAQGLPMSGSYPVVINGQTSSGSFSYILDWCPWDTAGLFSQVSLTDYPSSIQLSALMSSMSSDPSCGGCCASYGDGSSGLLGGANTVATIPYTLNNGYVTNTQSDISLVMDWISQTWEGHICSGETFSFSSLLYPVTATNVTSGPASITVQPQSLVVNAHDTASFNVTASGMTPFSYQWLLNATSVEETSSISTINTLTITNVSPTNLGNYIVVVSNEFGTNASTNVMLSMYPYIVTPFTGAITYWGQSSTLSVGAWGTGPLSYQWFQNGVALPNATNQALTLSSIQFTNAGLYSVVVSNAFGSATNTPEQVIVEPAGVSIGGLYPGIIINGTVGYNYVIESTADLSNTNSWVTMTNLTLTQPIQLWVDTNTDASQPGNPQRFYQVLPGN